MQSLPGELCCKESYRPSHPPAKTSTYYTTRQQCCCCCCCTDGRLTGHGGQLCGHVALCAYLLPGPRGEVVPPKLPEQRVVLVLRAARLLVVRVVAAKHVQVGVVGHAAVATTGGRRALAWRGNMEGSAGEGTPRRVNREVFLGMLIHGIGLFMG